MPLIFLPGLLNTARLWAEQVGALGTGRVIAVLDTASADSIPALASRALNRAPPRFALAGLSMGGYVAFEMWRQAPERIERLALLDTTARPDAPEQSARRRDLMDLAASEGIDAVVPRLAGALLAAPHAKDPRLLGVLLDMAREVGVAGFLNQQRAILGRPDSRPDLPAIRCPTVVVVGELDALTPPAVARETADAIPGATLEVVPGAGHLSPLENPEAVTDVLREWLEGG